MLTSRGSSSATPTCDQLPAAPILGFTVRGGSLILLLVAARVLFTPKKNIVRIRWGGWSPRGHLGVTSSMIKGQENKALWINIKAAPMSGPSTGGSSHLDIVRDHQVTYQGLPLSFTETVTVCAKASVDILPGRKLFGTSPCKVAAI